MRLIGDGRLTEIMEHNRGWAAIAFISYDSIPCKHFQPEFETFSKAMKEIYCAEIVAEEHPSMCSELGVSAVPTTIVLHKGKKVWAFEGPYSHEALERRMSEMLKSM